MKRSLCELAEILGGEMSGDATKIIRGAKPFENAADDEITYAGDARLLKRINETGAGAVIVPSGFMGDFTGAVIKVENPKVAFAKALALFYSPWKPKSGVSPAAHIGENFTCGREVRIGAMTSIGDHVTLGNGVTLHAGVIIEDHVVLGDDVEIFPNVSILERCEIGSRVSIQAGTVIGSDGYGFVFDGKKHHKVPQTGIVRIDDDVEIGAGNTIDRAAFGKTWIQKGVKTDNLVHIAHNVIVGEHTLLVAQVGIAGSSSIGKYVVIAGQAGIGGHLEIGDAAMIGSKAGIAKSVEKGDVVSGTPGMPHRIWLRVQRLLPSLPGMNKKILELEKRLDKMDRSEGLPEK